MRERFGMVTIMATPRTGCKASRRERMVEYDEYASLHYWIEFFGYSLLLAVQIIVLGIALAGLVSALRARSRDAGQPFNRPD